MRTGFMLQVYICRVLSQVTAGLVNENVADCPAYELRRLLRFLQQVAVAAGVVLALPVTQKLQACGLGHRDEFFRRRPERDCGSGIDYAGLSRELPVGHSADHPEPGSESVRAV